MIEKLSSPSSKENESIVISKDDPFDTMLIIIMAHLAYSSHVLQNAWLLHQSIVLLHENARCHTSNWTAVYGCTSDRLWISPGWHVIAIDANVKQVIVSCL